MTPQTPPVPGVAAKAGALLILLWSVLHVWVGGDGLAKFFAGDVKAQWLGFLGGTNAPIDAFVHTTDAVTANVHAHLMVNFCVDVGGYGVLGLLSAWLIWKQASWLGYFMFLVLVGICDLAFTFSFVTSGVIVLNAGTVGGPVLWVLACLITPFGLPRPVRVLAQT